MRYRIFSPTILAEADPTRYERENKPDAKLSPIVRYEDKLIPSLIGYGASAISNSPGSAQEGEKAIDKFIKPTATAVAYLAGRWAAKEATIKAVKPRKLTLNEIEIWDVDIEPVAVILDQAPAEPQPGETVQKMDRTTFDMLTGQIVRVSISHDYGNAIAVALAAEEMSVDGNGDVGAEAVARVYS